LNAILIQNYFFRDYQSVAVRLLATADENIVTGRRVAVNTRRAQGWGRYGKAFIVCWLLYLLS